MQFFWLDIANLKKKYYIGNFFPDLRNNLSKPRAINIKTSIVKKGINGRIKVYKSIKIINIIGEQQSFQEFLGVLEKSTRSDSPKEIWEAIMIKHLGIMEL